MKQFLLLGLILVLVWGCSKSNPNEPVLPDEVKMNKERDEDRAFPYYNSIYKWELDRYTRYTDKRLGIWSQNGPENDYDEYQKWGFTHIRTSVPEHLGHYDEIVPAYFSANKVQFHLHPETADDIAQYLSYNGIDYSAVETFYIDEPLEHYSNGTNLAFSYSELVSIAQKLAVNGKKLCVSSYTWPSASSPICQQYLALLNTCSNTAMTGMNYKNFMYSFWTEFMDLYPRVQSFYTSAAINQNDWTWSNINGVKNYSSGMNELWLYAANEPGYPNPSDDVIKTFVFKAWKTFWLYNRVEKEIGYNYHWEGSGNPPSSVVDPGNPGWVLQSVSATGNTRIAERPWYDYDVCPDL